MPFLLVGLGENFPSHRSMHAKLLSMFHDNGFAKQERGDYLIQHLLKWPIPSTINTNQQAKA